MFIKVVEYIREDGSNPFKAWFDALDPQAAAKVATAALRLELGNHFEPQMDRDRRGISHRLGAGLPALPWPRWRGADDFAGWRHQAAPTGRYRTGEGVVRRIQGPENSGQAQEVATRGNEMTLTRDFKETVNAR